VGRDVLVARSVVRLSWADPRHHGTREEIAGFPFADLLRAYLLLGKYLEKRATTRALVKRGVTLHVDAQRLRAQINVERVSARSTAHR
jgi:hypothetical protein